jgi:hypothetical protein
MSKIEKRRRGVSNGERQITPSPKKRTITKSPFPRLTSHKAQIVTLEILVLSYSHFRFLAQSYHQYRSPLLGSKGL